MSNNNGKSPMPLADNVAQCDDEHTETEESSEKPVNALINRQKQFVQEN